MEEHYYNPKNESLPCIKLKEFEHRKKYYCLDIYFDHTRRKFEISFYALKNSLTPVVADAVINCGLEPGKDSYLLSCPTDNKLAIHLAEICSALSEL